MMPECIPNPVVPKSDFNDCFLHLCESSEYKTRGFRITPKECLPKSMWKAYDILAKKAKEQYDRQRQKKSSNL